MACEYRTLLLITCGRRKKRLKNSNGVLSTNGKQYPHENSVQLSDCVLNNRREEDMNVKNYDYSLFLNDRKHSEYVKKNKCKKSTSQSFIPSIFRITSTFIISLIAMLSRQHSMTEAFNIDMGTRVVFSQPPSTMFGFSVAGHKEGNVGW